MSKSNIMPYWLKFIAVLCSMILADVAWAMYFIKVDERRSVAAGVWGSSILIFGAYTTVNYVHDHTLLVAALIGSFVGTFATVELKKWKEDLQSINAARVLKMTLREYIYYNILNK